MKCYYNFLKVHAQYILKIVRKRNESFHRKDIISIRRIEVGQVNLELIVKLPNSSSMS